MSPLSPGGEALLAQSHPLVGEVSQRPQALGEAEAGLALRGQDLEDKRNFLEFLQRADIAEAWIQEMVRPSWAGTELGVGLRD